MGEGTCSCTAKGLDVEEPRLQPGGEDAGCAIWSPRKSVRSQLYASAHDSSMVLMHRVDHTTISPTIAPTRSSLPRRMEWSTLSSAKESPLKP